MRLCHLPLPWPPPAMRHLDRAANGRLTIPDKQATQHNRTPCPRHSGWLQSSCAKYRLDNTAQPCKTPCRAEHPTNVASATTCPNPCCKMAELPSAPHEAKIGSSTT